MYFRSPCIQFRAVIQLTINSILYPTEVITSDDKNHLYQHRELPGEQQVKKLNPPTRYYSLIISFGCRHFENKSETLQCTHDFSNRITKQKTPGSKLLQNSHVVSPILLRHRLALARFLRDIQARSFRNRSFEVTFSYKTQSVWLSLCERGQS